MLTRQVGERTVTPAGRSSPAIRRPRAPPLRSPFLRSPPPRGSGGHGGPGRVRGVGRRGRGGRTGNRSGGSGPSGGSPGRSPRGSPGGAARAGRAASAPRAAPSPSRRRSTGAVAHRRPTAASGPAQKCRLGELACRGGAALPPTSPCHHGVTGASWPVHERGDTGLNTGQSTGQKLGRRRPALQSLATLASGRGSSAGVVPAWAGGVVPAGAAPVSPAGAGPTGAAGGVATGWLVLSATKRAVRAIHSGSGTRSAAAAACRSAASAAASSRVTCTRLSLLRPALRQPRQPRGPAGPPAARRRRQAGPASGPQARAPTGCTKEGPVGRCAPRSADGRSHRAHRRGRHAGLVRVRSAGLRGHGVAGCDRLGVATGTRPPPTTRPTRRRRGRTRRAPR